MNRTGPGTEEGGREKGECKRWSWGTEKRPKYCYLVKLQHLLLSQPLTNSSFSPGLPLPLPSSE